MEDKKAESESARYGDRTYVFRVLISSKKRKILSSDISGARIQDFIFVPTRDYFRADNRIPDGMFRRHEEFRNREPLMSSFPCREQCRNPCFAVPRCARFHVESLFS